MLLTPPPAMHAELRGDVRGEWDELKQHDVVFLVTVRPPDEVALSALHDSGAALTPADLYGLVYVRGAEVIEVSSLPLAACCMPLLWERGLA